MEEMEQISQTIDFRGLKPILLFPHPAGLSKEGSAQR